MGLSAVILIRPVLACGEDAANGWVAGIGEDRGGEVVPKIPGVVETTEPIWGAGDRESNPIGLASSPAGACKTLLAFA